MKDCVQQFPDLPDLLLALGAVVPGRLTGPGWPIGVIILIPPPTPPFSFCTAVLSETERNVFIILP